MIAHPRPLIDVFAAIPDFRMPRGKRHDAPALITGASPGLFSSRFDADIGVASTTTDGIDRAEVAPIGRGPRASQRCKIPIHRKLNDPVHDHITLHENILMRL